MNRYHYIIISCVLALMSIGVQAQLPDSIYCYLTKNIKTEKKKSYSSTELLLYNSSKDTIIIKNFSKGIRHALFNEIIDGFYWDYLTISNEAPECDDVMMTGKPPITGMIINGKSFTISELMKDETIVIPPHSLFVSDVHMLFSNTNCRYQKGYYKMCLYYDKHIIAEAIVKL